MQYTPLLNDRVLSGNRLVVKSDVGLSDSTLIILLAYFVTNMLSEKYKDLADSHIQSI